MPKKKHSKLPPSGADRWLTCTASASLEENYPGETSVYAEEGTLAHEFADLFAKGRTDQIAKKSLSSRRSYLKKKEHYSPEMEHHAAYYADYVGRIVEETGGFAETEVRLDLTDWVPAGFGTADCIVVAEPDLYVIDYKYGKGVPVPAEDNSQLKLYALGAVAKYGALYEIETVHLTIVQPRLGVLDEWALPLQELLRWGSETVQPKALEAATGPGKFCPSEKACRFCRARGECRARADQIVGLFDDNPPELLSTLTLDEQGQLLEKAKEMKAWLADLEGSVYGHLAAGDEVAGWKLVEGRSVRKITDPVEVAKRLEIAGLGPEAIWETKLIGVSQIEKLLGKKEAGAILDGVVKKPKGKPTLAPVSDKRPAYTAQEAVLEAFDK